MSFYANRTLLGTATASPYTITWPNPPVWSYALKAVASNIVGLTNASARVNVVIAPSAAQFAISSQPATLTVAAGSSVTFAVGITGTNSVSYQWSHNGTLIPGATHPNVSSCPPIQDSAAGTYTVAVTSGRTTLTSDAAELTVQDPPVFTLSPNDKRWPPERRWFCPPPQVVDP